MGSIETVGQRNVLDIIQNGEGSVQNVRKLFTRNNEYSCLSHKQYRFIEYAP